MKKYAIIYPGGNPTAPTVMPHMIGSKKVVSKVWYNIVVGTDAPPFLISGYQAPLGNRIKRQ